MKNLTRITACDLLNKKIFRKGAMDSNPLREGLLFRLLIAQVRFSEPLHGRRNGDSKRRERQAKKR